MASHIFFCNEMDCSNTTTYNGATCYDCCEAMHDNYCTCNGSTETCDYCTQYFADKAEEAIWCGVDETEGGALCMDCKPTHVCNGEWDYDLGYRVCDNSDDEDCPQHKPRCTCDGSGRMCDLRDDRYNERHASSMESLRAEIAEIEFRLLGRMTERQKDDWRKGLQKLYAKIAELEQSLR